MVNQRDFFQKSPCKYSCNIEGSPEVPEGTEGKGLGHGHKGACGAHVGIRALYSGPTAQSSDAGPLLFLGSSAGHGDLGDKGLLGVTSRPWLAL